MSSAMSPWQRLKTGAPSVFAADIHFNRNSSRTPSDEVQIKLAGSLQPIKARNNQIRVEKAEPGRIPQALRSSKRGQ